MIYRLLILAFIFSGFNSLLAEKSPCCNGKEKSCSGSDETSECESIDGLEAELEEEN